MPRQFCELFQAPGDKFTFHFAQEKCSATATDAANVAINAGIILVETYQGILGECGRRNMDHSRLAAAD